MAEDLDEDRDGVLVGQVWRGEGGHHARTAGDDHAVLGSELGGRPGQLRMLGTVADSLDATALWRTVLVGRSEATPGAHPRHPRQPALRFAAGRFAMMIGEVSRVIGRWLAPRGVRADRWCYRRLCPRPELVARATPIDVFSGVCLKEAVVKAGRRPARRAWP
jgi:hypothetical protein